jgi:hypothetical protein
VIKGKYAIAGGHTLPSCLARGLNRLGKCHHGVDGIDGRVKTIVKRAEGLDFAIFMVFDVLKMEPAY